MDTFYQLPATSISTDDLEFLAFIASCDSEDGSQTALVDEEKHGGGIAVAFCVIS